MTKDHVHETHAGIVKRLKRAEGHLHRVIEMFAEGRSCLELAQQLHALLEPDRQRLDERIRVDR